MTMTKPSVPPHRFLALLGTIGLIAAACATAPPPTPLRSLGPGETPVSTWAWPSYSLEITTPRPTPACQDEVANGALPWGELTISTPKDDAELTVDPTGFQRDGEAAIPLPIRPRAEPRDISTLVGGRDVNLAFAAHVDDSGDLTPTSMLGITVRFIDASGLTVLPARLVPAGAVITMPDRSTTGRLDIDVTWTHPCFTIAGFTSATVEVVPSAIADACPDADRIRQQVIEGQQTLVRLGDASVRLNTTSWAARFVGAGSGDHDGPIDDFDPAAAPATAEPGGLVPLSITEPGYQSRGAALLIHRWDDVVDADGHILDTGTSPVPIELAPAPGGTIDVPFPAAPGRYVFEFFLRWGLTCVVGEGHFYIAATST